jgi:periplasmic protein CpxP/Spy
MKRWIKLTLAGVFGATLLGGGLLACSHRHHHAMTDAERLEWQQKMVSRAASKLDLDAAQKTRLEALAQAVAAQRAPVMGASDPRAELLGVMSGEKLDRARAQAWIDARTAALRDGAPRVLAASADFYDSLRPEQQAQLRELLQRGRRHGWRA